MNRGAQTNSARSIVAHALAGAAAAFPDLHPISLRTSSLEPRDRHLAEAIHRAALQRWITLEYLLDRHSRQPMRKLEPRLRALLLSAAAQLLVLDRMPDAAVVDETVGLTGKLVRPGARGMVNAVLRKLAADIVAIEAHTPWTPAEDRLPYEGGSILLRGNVLPPTEKLDHHLSVATSHPRPLVRRWFDTHGPVQTTEMCRHGVCNPPTFVVEGEQSLVWGKSHVELVQYLAEHPDARVQDPTAAEAVRATSALAPLSVLDYCAGRGTKTRQAAALHPQARVVATDINPERLAELTPVPPNVQVLPMEQVSGGDYDLLILDVPCTNTGTLARRPEARYRFSQSTLDQLVNLQKQIIERAPALVKRGGHVLYSTCSVEREENQKQAARLAKLMGATITQEKLTLPAGHGAAYHDGGYFALMKL